MSAKGTTNNRVENERELVSRLESADINELIQIVAHPEDEAERILRTHLGSERYQRLHSLALRREMLSNAQSLAPQGNVVVIPSFLGSQLTCTSQSGEREHVWLSPRHIVAGWLMRLRLNESGLCEFDERYTIQPTGILKRYYGELLLTLAQSWNVHAFWYDWRKDFRIAANELYARINSWFPEDEPVHIVAHGMGGLVARWYIHRFAERWKVGKNGMHSRLIMLGTPNHGLFSIPVAMAGELPIIRWANALDRQNGTAEYRTLVNSFPSVYQMLPSPHKVKGVDFLYEPTTYSTELNISSQHLQAAKRQHNELGNVETPTQIVQVCGYGQPTFSEIKFDLFKRLVGSKDSRSTEIGSVQPTDVFMMSRCGDGNAPSYMLELEGVPTFYIEDDFANLQSNHKVLAALHGLLTCSENELQRGNTVNGLERSISTAGEKPSSDSDKAYKENIAQIYASDARQLDSLVRRVRLRSPDALDRAYITEEEHIIDEVLTRGFLLRRNSGNGARPVVPPFDPPAIKINLLYGNIMQLDNGIQIGPLATAGNGFDDVCRICTESENAGDVHWSGCAIDAIATGHYMGSKPHGVLLNLDEEVSRVMAIRMLMQQENKSWESASIRWYREHRDIHVPEDELLLTAFTQRGTIRGQLAETFFLDDPRPAAEESERVIAVAGMGLPGRFGEPELAVLVRELCWTLGRMGKHHLATLLIGTGRNNLPIAGAVTGWIRGLKQALTGVKPEYALDEITFVIHDPSNVLDFDKALRREQKALGDRQRMCIQYTPLTQTAMNKLQADRQEYAMKQVRHYRGGDAQKRDQASTRVTVSVEGKKYRFGAITQTASVPERDIPLDPGLVRDANNQLVAEGNPERLLELGKFMERLLLPEDLRDELYSPTPLVMMVDTNTARIHWELLARTDNPSTDWNESDTEGETVEEQFRNSFWGTSRGFTRQLRTAFAPPPEPPPPASRMIRVLVVADPARDAPLPGAEEEGILVADLFEQFNLAHIDDKNRVQVVRLFGPHEATRTEVLRHLMQHTYDVLHFAGHCVFDAEDPAASGWIFSNDERLSAYELTRIDRVPKFVFSNACESGLTPDRSDRRTVALAPSFAEAFFNRGVSNFVCTAWPVDDRAARDFALTLYANLLGMETVPPEGAANVSAMANDGYVNISENRQFRKMDPKPMHEAMREARCAIARPPHDIRTWGSYQHYGNPYFRLFSPKSTV